MPVSFMTRLARAAATLLLTLSLVGTAQAAQSTAESAVQEVIQRGNDAQARALATRDSSILADSAVDAYYRQLVRTNQSLLDSGVTTIELVDIQWGPMTVGGATATVTAFETWRTSYAD